MSHVERGSLMQATPGLRGKGAGLLFAIVVGAAGCTPARAWASSCAGVAPATVIVDVSSDEVREAFDTTAADIHRAAAARGIDAHWPVLSAYVSNIAYVAAIEDDTRPDDGGFCATPVSVRLAIAFKDRAIHLARAAARPLP